LIVGHGWRNDALAWYTYRLYSDKPMNDFSRVVEPMRGSDDASIEKSLPIHDVVARRAPVKFYTLGLFMMIYWPAVALLILAVGLATRPFLSRKRHRELGQSILARAFGSFIWILEMMGIMRVSDDDLKEARKVKGPLIIASNHPAMWDALLLMRRFGQVGCVMKKELLSNPLLGSGARFAGFIASTPRTHTIRVAAERLAEGGRLLFFPEGTRTRKEQGVVNSLRPGLALLAKESGAPVLPVFISTNSCYLEKGWPPWKEPELPINISIRLGEQIQMESGEEVRDFTERLERIFKEELR
jgi:1-acyl-sn-glycerol-3-phosphate acyltransferase